MAKSLTCLVIALLFPVLLLSEENTLYWGGTGGNWSAAHWYDNEDLGGTAQSWQDGSRAVITGSGASVVVDQSIVAAGVDLHEDAEIRIGGSHVLRIEGATDGEGTVIFTNTSGDNMGPDHGLIVDHSDPQELAWRLQLHNDQVRINLSIIGRAQLTFQGKAQAWGNDFRIYLGSETHLLIGSLAEINNNRSDLVNARPFWVHSADDTALLEFHPHFVADLADETVFEDDYPYAYPDDDPGDGSYVKPVGGMSTWRNTSGTTVTHSSRNLATIHKYTGGEKRYTHHGLWNFEGDAQDPDPRWIVRSNAQSYDGGIYYIRDWTLVTEEDFTFEGIWHEGVNIGFASRNQEGVTVRKEGPADFIIRGTQSYSPDSHMQVAEGRVRFYTDPKVPEQARDNNGWFSQGGNYLHLTVEPDAAVHFHPPLEAPFHLYQGSIEGQLVLELAADREQAVLHIDGDMDIAGSLRLEVGESLQGAGYRLLKSSQGMLSLSATEHEIPHGWELRLEDDQRELWLRPSQDGADQRRIALHSFPQHHWLQMPEESPADEQDDQLEYFNDNDPTLNHIFRLEAHGPEGVQ
ncbi:MAG: hypothetical protein EA401_10690 [Planctomycetota bacterium]|nr:MAG: hypothetical protein EA401_10690 [Planctomycetota bacterium]